MMGAVGTIGHSVGYLESLGVLEPSADSMFNRRHCKDVFICLLLVTVYTFVMKIPRPTGVQGLRSIRVAVAQTKEGTLDHPVVIDQRPAEDTLDQPVVIDQRPGLLRHRTRNYPGSISSQPYQ